MMLHILIGMLIGVPIGVAALCLCIIAKRSDKNAQS